MNERFTIEMPKKRAMFAAALASAVRDSPIDHEIAGFWLIDRQSGGRYLLNDDERGLFDRSFEAFNRRSITQTFLQQKAIGAASALSLLYIGEAIVENRAGQSDKYVRLSRLTGDDWITWHGAAIAHLQVESSNVPPPWPQQDSEK